MASGGPSLLVSFRIASQATRKGLRDIQRRADRGTMWALRESGRQVKREARRRAPVYRGDRKDVEAGLYKRAIHSSKRLKREPLGGYSLMVGPRGPRVRLYAGKVEASHKVMAGAYDAVLPRIREIHARAWSRAIHRR